MNAPQTVEGEAVWYLAGQIDRQVRVGPAGGLIGFDMTAALAVARVGGINEAAVIEFQSTIEARMVEVIDAKMRDNSDG